MRHHKAACEGSIAHCFVNNVSAMATWQDYGVLPQPDAISPSFFNSHSSARAADVVSQRRRMTKMVTTQQMFDEVVKGMLIGRPDGCAHDRTL